MSRGCKTLPTQSVLIFSTVHMKYCLSVHSCSVYMDECVLLATT